MFFVGFILGTTIYIFTLFVTVVLRNFCQRERGFLATLPEFAKKKMITHASFYNFLTSFCLMDHVRPFHSN